MSKKITSSTGSSSLSRYKKASQKKRPSESKDKGKVSGNIKSDSLSQGSKSVKEPVKYCPPVKNDNLNISEERMRLLKIIGIKKKF